MMHLHIIEETLREYSVQNSFALHEEKSFLKFGRFKFFIWIINCYRYPIVAITIMILEN